MYAEWTSLQGQLQCEKSNKSVLHKFPATVGFDVANSVVKQLAQNLSISVANCEASILVDDKDVKWTMEVLCYGLSLPLIDHEVIRDCVNVYCEWLSALTTPKVCVPKPIVEDPNPFSQDMMLHLLNLFVPRPGSGSDLVKRQAVLCHRVLRTIEGVSIESTILTRQTWESLLKFLLTANDSLLSPPTEKDTIGLSNYDIGDHLCQRVLSVLFEMWLLACSKCFPSPSLWKTFQHMSIYWRHHEALVLQWHKVNHALTSKLIKFMYGQEFPALEFTDEEMNQFVPAEMTNDCVAQSWFRFLHIIQNPVDLCHPEIISQTPKFLHMALVSESVIDPQQHECLQKLPQIYYKAMKGISVMVNAFLGIPQSLKEEAIQQSNSNYRQTSTTTPPSQRKSSKNVPVGSSVGFKGSKSSQATTPKTTTIPPVAVPGQLTLRSNQSLSPQRPKSDSILHLFGAWLFEAALAEVRLHPSHINLSKSERRTSSLTDSKHNSVAYDTATEPAAPEEYSYEAGRAEACGALCRAFCAHKTGEAILPVYYSRFYLVMYYGLQTDESTISGQVLSNILFNSCDILRADLDGILLLVPYFLNAIELVLYDLNPKFKLCDQIPLADLRKSCIHLLLSMLCLPLHFKDLPIKGIVPNTDSGNKSTFIALKVRMTEILLRALLIEIDSANTQMLLGGLLLLVQDLAVFEEAEQMTLQPQQDLDDVTESRDASADTSKTSQSTTSSSASYQDTPYQRLSAQPQDLEMAFGLFGQATSLVSNRLMASWTSDLNTALAAFELLAGLSKVSVKPPNMLMCKRTVKWICDFIVYQCSRPAQHHSRDLHSMIVAAFKCLSLWLVQHHSLLYDKECLHNVLEVVELGISGSKSQNRVSDPPKYKGEKQLMPKSMRVKEAAESLLTCIIDQAGAFPPPCGPESLFSLLDERSLLKYAKGSALPEHGSPFRYFVLDNSIIVGLLEQPLGNAEDPLPTVTALIRGPFGRHAWTMQLRHSPRMQKISSRIHLAEQERPKPKNNTDVQHSINQKYFPDVVEKIPLTMADKSIPSLDSLVSGKEAQELESIQKFIEDQTKFENDVNDRVLFAQNKASFPNQQTECKPPRICHEYQTARLFLSHYGFLSLESLREPTNSTVPPSLVMLDTSNSGLFQDLEFLDTIPNRDYDTVHVFYVKTGQKSAQGILKNVNSRLNVQPQFLEFLHSMGWPVDVKKHPGWTGHVNTSWKVLDIDELDDDECPNDTGGAIYDGRSQVLYWADVACEIAFVVPTPELYEIRASALSQDSSVEKSPSPFSSERSSSVDQPSKPKSLLLDATRNGGDSESPGSPQDINAIRMRRTGRQTAAMVGPDTKILIVWLENFEDHETFPTAELLGVTSTGLEQFTTVSSSSIQRAQEKDTNIVFIHALQNGLFRIHMQGHTGKVAMAIPLIDGMVISRRCLGTFVRQTAINICRRKRLESESYQPPHVRRKLKIQETVNKYQSKLTEPEFYTALFQDVSK